MSKSKKTVIVTGGAGYIGSHTIVEIIQRSNFNVISLDNFSNSSEKVFDRIEEITGVRVQNYDLDLCDSSQLKSALNMKADIDGVIHFAAYKSVGESVKNPHKYYYNNINSLLNILNFCTENRVPNLIFSSSCSIYGDSDDLPVKEGTSWGAPKSPYAHTKQIGEKMIENFIKAHPGLHALALRYFNPAGAHISGLIGDETTDNSKNLIPIITQTAIGKISELTIYGNNHETRDGTCIRDYVHVSDVANAHVCALMYLIDRKNHSEFSSFNIGAGAGVTVLEAICAFERVTNRKVSYRVGSKRDGDVVAIYSDSMLAQTELGWTPKYSLEDMMSTAWTWELHQAAERSTSK